MLKNNKQSLKFAQWAVGVKTVLLVCCFLYSAVLLPVAELPANWHFQGWEAQAKKKKLTAAMVKKELTTLQPEIVRLLGKSRSRGLFTPEDSDKVNQIRETLNLLIGGSPKSEELVEPAYQAGQLFMARELYFDSFEAFSFIETKFPKNAYATKAGYMKKQVLKRMPADDRQVLEEQATVVMQATPTKTPTPKK